MKESTYHWVVDHNRSLPLVLAATLLGPERLVRGIYAKNAGKPRNWKGKKSCFTLSFDCDYPRDAEALPYVLKLLKKYGIKTTFAVVGHWMEKYPDFHKQVVAEGHEIMNHTYSHPDNEILNPGRKFREISRAEKMEEVVRCHELCVKILGVAPTGLRIPHFKNLFTPDIYGILKELGYRYSSSTCLTNTKSAGDPYVAKHGVLEFPLSTCPKHPFTVFDGWHSLNSDRLFYRWIHKNEKQYQGLFKTLVDIGIETNSYINVYTDPSDLVQMKNFEQLLAYLKDREGDVLIAPYADLLDDPSYRPGSMAVR